MIEKVGIDYQDRRSHRRGPGMLAACLIHADDGRLAGCQLLNLSTGGATVKLDQMPDEGRGLDLSSAIRLRIAATDALPVEVVWQEGLVVGLRFPDASGEKADALAEVLALGGKRLDDLDWDNE
jgi:hypothetical protein